MLNDVLKGLIDLSVDELQIVKAECKERIVKAVENEISIGDEITLTHQSDNDTYVVIKKMIKNYTIRNKRTNRRYTCPPGLMRPVK